MELQFRQAGVEFRTEVREFIDTHWPREVRKRRAEASYYPAQPSARDEAWFDALIERGWSVPLWPEAYGGAGWNPTQKFIWDCETARAETPQMNVFGVAVLAPVLYTWGSEMQKERFLPPIREARVRWCQGYSEPGAGSDLASLTTRAVREGDHYIVNGTKAWISGGHIADWMFCLVRTADADCPEQGISLLLIEMAAPGIEVHPIKTLGDHHTVDNVSLVDVRVPAAHLVGEENSGWTYATASLTHERTNVARVAALRMQLQRLQRIARETEQDGTHLGEDAAFRRKVSELEIDLLGLEMLELRTLAAVERDGAPGPESAILSLKGTEIDQRIAELAVEVLGYYALPFPDALLMDNEGGIGPDFTLPVLQGMLFSRSCSIYGGTHYTGASFAGTNEIQKNMIAKSVLGL